MKSLAFLLSVFATSSVAIDSCNFQHNSMELSLEQIKVNKGVLHNPLRNSLDDTNHIDLMAFYQPAYAKIKGEEWVHARIAYLVQQANEVFSNSGINTRVRLVNAQPVTGIPDDLPYKSVYDTDGKLIKEGAGRLFSARVLNPYEGYPEATIYNEFGADLAVYFRDFRENEDENLGQASQGRELSVIFDKKVNDEDFLLGDLTLIHEIGHNLDAGHEINAEDVNSSFAEAHAYSCGGRNTVMWSTASSTMHNFFSNPMLNVGDESCGIDGESNNHFVIEENSLVAAQRRTSPAIDGVVYFGSATYKFSEDDGLVRVDLKRSGDLSSAVSVQVALIPSSAKSSEDYLADAQRIVFEANSDTAYYEFEVVSDALEEGVETATLILRYPYKLDIETNTALVEFEDISAGQVGSFVIDNPLPVIEGDAAELKLRRIGGSDGEVILSINTENDSAISSVDYEFADEIIKFADGETSKTVYLNTIDDDIKEFDEDFFVNISSAMDVEISNPKVTVRIKDNDETEFSLGQLTLEVESLTVSESVGKISVVVNRVNGSHGSIEARLFTKNAGQVSGIDFKGVDQQIVFAEGEITKAIDIEILDDSNVEGGDTSFYVQLESVSAEVLKSELKVTITDNDTESKPVEPPTAEKGNEKSGGSFGFYLIVLIGILCRKLRTISISLYGNRNAI